MEKEKINLNEHKELFKILPEQEYSSLEKTLEHGLYLTPQGIEGQGEKQLQENLARALPSLYDRFEKIGNLKQKLEKKKLVPGWASTTIVLSDMIIAPIEAIAFGVAAIQNPNAWPALLALSLHGTLGFAGWARALYLGIKHHVPDLSEEEKQNLGLRYITPNALLATNYYRTKRACRKKRLKNQSAKVRKELIKIGYGSLIYNEKWVKKQKNELLKILDETGNQQEFINAYNQVDKRLTPFHRIELQKNIEKDLYKEIAEAEPRSRLRRSPHRAEDIKKTAEKLRKAKKAGIILDSVKEGLKQKINEKKEEIKELKQALKGIEE